MGETTDDFTRHIIGDVIRSATPMVQSVIADLVANGRLLVDENERLKAALATAERERDEGRSLVADVTLAAARRDPRPAGEGRTAAERERLGRAACLEWMRHLDPGVASVSPSWESMHEEAREVYRRIAEAVLAAAGGGAAPAAIVRWGHPREGRRNFELFARWEDADAFADRAMERGAEAAVCTPLSWTYHPAAGPAGEDGP